MAELVLIFCLLTDCVTATLGPGPEVACRVLGPSFAAQYQASHPTLAEHHLESWWCRRIELRDPNVPQMEIS